MFSNYRNEQMIFVFGEAENVDCVAKLPDFSVSSIFSK